MKRIQKGFTLIELIIVLAIFSIILALVMSFIDPVTKIMRKATVREQTAAYVDNIGEYLDNSLHYAQFVRVYNGGFCSTSDTSIEATEKEAVEELVRSCLNGAVDFEGKPLKGRARVLKLINTATDDCPDVGQIYESVYDFEAGDITGVKQPDDSMLDTEKVPLKANPVSGKQNMKVINEEHFVDYNYYYNTGFYTLNTLIDPENFSSTNPSSSKSYAPSNRSYYSTLYPILDNSGSKVTMSYARGRENLCVNVVAYKNDEPDNKETVYYTHDEDTDEVVVFKSPAQLTATSMLLANVSATNDPNTAVFVRLIRDPENMGEPKRNAAGALQFEPVPTINFPYAVYNSTNTDATDNVYFVFILPEEIFDTDIIYE